MATHRHGLDTKFYFHTLDFTPYVEEVDPSFERDLAEYAPLSASWKSSLPGLRSITMSLAGLHDSTDDLIQDVAWSIFDGSTSPVFAYLPNTDTIEYAAYCGDALVNSDKVTAGDDVVRCPVEVIGTDRADRAKIAHVLAAETSTGSETAIDDGAAVEEDLGFEAYLICTAFTATDTLDVIIEDSDDDGVGDAYTTAGTFTQLTAVGSEHITVAAGAAALKRYVKVSWTIVDNSGDPEMTFFVAYFRKE
jgi:hypothetical protein